MAYTGNGTASSPWIVDDWNDFITLATSADNQGKYIKFVDAETKKIDLNEIAPTGISTLNIYANIDFNGWTIENAYIKGRNAITLLAFSAPQYFKNGIFENLYFLNDTGGENSGVIFAYSSRYEGIWTIENNVFSGKYISITDTNNPCVLFNASRDKMKMSRCSMNFDISHTNGSKSTSYSLFRQGIIDNCKFVANTSVNGIVDISPYATLSDTLVQIAAPNAAEVRIGGSTTCAFEISTDNLTVTTAASTSIYNADLIKKSKPTGGIIGCTEAQMRDAAELAKIGFPIGVD